MLFFYVVKQYERAVVFKLGKVEGPPRGPGLTFIVTFVQRIRRVSLRLVTMPIQSQGTDQGTMSINGELVTSDRQQQARPVASAPDNP